MIGKKRNCERAAVGALAFILAILLPLAIEAQTTGNSDRPSAPPEQPGTTAPNTPSERSNSGSSDSLSKDLSRSRGVIPAPEHVDPEMQQKPPPVGPQSTPVIPPPGTPGGNPTVQPK